MTRLISLVLGLAMLVASVPVSQAQVCAPDSPTPGVGVVKEAFDLVSARFVEPLGSAQLLPPAAAAVVAEVRKSSGAKPIPDADAWFSGDPASSWGRFAERYCQAWEARGEGVSPESVAYPAIRAITAAVHEAHTGFLTPQMYKEHLAWTSTGQIGYEGVGIRLRSEPLRVDYVFAGSPAEAAGLRSGDEILSINGVASTELTPAGAAVAMRGEAGTSVQLRLRRNGTPADWDVVLVRARITIPSVESRMVDDIGYLQIRGFPRTALFDEVNAALQSLNDRGARALVLDLRGNAGGRLDVGASVAGLFLPDGSPLYQETIRGSQTTRRVTPSTNMWAKPFAVLVDEGTASMGEILAAAIQEQHAAPVLGTKTAGAVAGSLVLPLSDGSAVQETVIRIDSGQGRVLNEVGVQPDMEVRSSPAPGPGDAPLDAALGLLRTRTGPQNAFAPDDDASPDRVATPELVPAGV